LNGIIVFADLLEENLGQNDLKNYANIIIYRAKNLLSIINDILDYSKIEENKLIIENINANIPQEIESVVELFYVSALEKSINLILKIDPFFPNCIISDPVRIRQIISNLVSNAIKFTPENGRVLIEVKYLCSVEDECAQLYISVEDSGIGIAKSQQERIFEAFSQADSTTTRKYGGTGLGLTISSKLVSLLGGELMLESELNKGSKFYFTIDINECSGVTSRLPAFKPQKEQIAVYADDFKDFSQQKLLANYLDLFGFKSVMFDIDSDFDSIGNESFDLLFVFNSTKKNIDSLKSISKKIVFVFKLINDFDSNGSDDVLYCPIYGSKLYKTIKKVLGDSRPRTEIKNQKQQKISSKALVVEDNEVNQKLISIILTEMDAEVKLASNGLEALSLFKTEKFDFIFMDINMPLMGGVETTREMLSIEKERGWRHTPIIALTANIQKENKDKFLSVGMDDYLQKPISRKTVEEIVAKYVQITKKDITNDEISVISDESLDFDSALRGLGVNATIMLELIKEFLTNFIEIKDSIELSLKINDTDELFKSIHKLKGVSGNLRMKKIHNLCKQMEDSLDGKVFLNELLQKIYNEIELIKKRLQ
ncbi:MAG: hypothetical protein QG567_1673, partial [Campylobacterota bacterium]|nr:hypothetical protein [Campylobacterota bacterium]